MKGFILFDAALGAIHFSYYLNEAPLTCEAFDKLLPFERPFFHARVSGQEIWFDNLAPLSIPQENASVFTLPGEVVLGPASATRTKTMNCFGIYYGEGKGLDACNIFAKVIEADVLLLEQLGNEIWRNGSRHLTLSRWV